MKQQINAVILAVGAVLAALILVVGINMASQGAKSAKAKDDPPVTTPIASPHETVAPGVASEMNGKPGKVKMAEKIKMHAPAKGLTGLAGKGRGNGCLKDYGTPGQCLPLLSPAQQAMPEMDHPWTCDAVRELFPQGISVHGKDTLGLDSNGDRTMCGPGDG
jgi:hypothetical protein